MMEDYSILCMVVCVEREEPHMLPEQEQQHPEDEDELFGFVIIFV